MECGETPGLSRQAALFSRGSCLELDLCLYFPPCHRMSGKYRPSTSACAATSATHATRAGDAKPGATAQSLSAHPVVVCLLPVFTLSLRHAEARSRAPLWHPPLQKSPAPYSGLHLPVRVRTRPRLRPGQLFSLHTRPQSTRTTAIAMTQDIMTAMMAMCSLLEAHKQFILPSSLQLVLCTPI